MANQEKSEIVEGAANNAEGNGAARPNEVTHIS